VTAAGLDQQEQRLLTELLEAQHAALYGYGVLGARLDAATRPAAQTAANAHRSTRDRLAGLLRAGGAQAPAPLPAYDVAVAGQPDALELAVRLEEGLSVRWLDLVGGTDAFGLRRLGVDGLTETAVRAASWRRLLGRQPPTVALPGTAESG
jgi:hypothetical protein